MTKRAIMPPEFRAAAERLKLSPGIISGSHVFLTGVTGSRPDGSMPEPASEQIRNAFLKVDSVLREARLTLAAVVDMTSYHVGLQQHFETFDALRLEFFDEPYPAWTAVEVAGLRRPGAVVEVRVIASTEQTI